MSDAEGGSADENGARRKSTVEWHQDAMATSFANVVNIQGTREQVEVFFGVSRSLNAESEASMDVDLSNRVILTPHAAKRLLLILNGVVREYESRHGVLNVEDK